MIELVLTINDRDGSYTEHAGVVLASIFSNTQQTINVHIVHDDSLSDENKLRLTQLVDAFHHNIFFYHVAIPGDFLEVAAGVNKIDYWTIASMYRLLLPQIIQADRVIYLDCDILVNMDINELWSVDLGGRYLGAVRDQGVNLMEYFVSLGLNAELYFNSGVILFHLNNIRSRETWYQEMLGFMRTFPSITMPDQDILNALYSLNYVQLDLRFNTFAHPELDLENKIVHFAGDGKWWNEDSPAAPLYQKFLAMTPWAPGFIPAPAPVPESIIPLDPPPPPQEEQSIAPPEPPAPEIQIPDPPVLEIPAPQVEVPEIAPVKPHGRKRRRLVRLRRRLRLRRKLRLRRRLRLRLKKFRLIRAKYRSRKRVKLLKRRRAAKSKALKPARKRLRRVRTIHTSRSKRPLKRTS
ncbi:glycosyltransferase family 8 protein [Paenibacillus sp. URB8-2]|uniref:glycosyltransferase family 8 protein n=1 Tax=Paenibacillus sp. URB8-2 TaxID=2741301 RepID=UPI0015B85F7A|nr:glycosyltransferase family 8 protein [Paenibacillus sp. URB8-2]BCG57759.1 hypothetical protein PUR_11840 [Paenibacillus sp. URB8-2]